MRLASLAVAFGLIVTGCASTIPRGTRACADPFLGYWYVYFDGLEDANPVRIRRSGEVTTVDRVHRSNTMAQVDPEDQYMDVVITGDSIQWTFIDARDNARASVVLRHVSSDRMEGTFKRSNCGAHKYELRKVPRGTIRAVDMVGYGICRIQRTGERIQLQSTATGVIELGTSYDLIAATSRVPAVVGTSFGCHFVLVGEPINAFANVNVVVEHPPFKKPGGEITGTTDNVPCQYAIGREVSYSYTFDEDWEAVPGIWSIQVWHDGKRLAMQEFVVTRTGE